MTITERKQQAINEILTARQDYKGKQQSQLEKKFDNLYRVGKLMQEDYDTLLIALDNYKQQLIGDICNSQRVFVRFDTNFQDKYKSYPFANLDELLEPLEPLEPLDME